MDSTAGGWLAMGALIALVGMYCRGGVRRFLVLAGVVVAAWGMAPVVATVYNGTETTVTVAAPAPVASATPARPGFWAGMSDYKKFFMVFFGIALLCVFIGWAADDGPWSIILILVGAAGMAITGIAWLVS